MTDEELALKITEMSTKTANSYHSVFDIYSNYKLLLFQIRREKKKND